MNVNMSLLFTRNTGLFQMSSSVYSTIDDIIILHIISKKDERAKYNFLFIPISPGSNSHFI